MESPTINSSTTSAQYEIQKPLMREPLISETSIQTPSRAIYIGRFQPFSKAHLEIVQYIARHDYVDEIIVGIGSSQFDYRNSSILGGPLENPFTFEERKEMIERSVTLEGIVKKVIVMGIQDLFNIELWTASVLEQASPFRYYFNNKQEESKLFELAGIEIVPIHVPVDKNLKAGNIRRKMIAGDQVYREYLPTGTITVLDRINACERMKGLKEESVAI